MLNKFTLNKYIKDSIDQGNMTENLQKSVDKLYKQIDQLRKSNKELIGIKNRWYSALNFYASNRHVTLNKEIYKNDKYKYKYINGMAIELGQVARDALIDTNSL